MSGFNAGEAAQATITGLEGADGAAIPRSCPASEQLRFLHCCGRTDAADLDPD